MKKGKLINSEISYVISKLGHTDGITIGDCGLPIPEGAQRIDLAVTLGVPSFTEVLNTVLSEQWVEEVILAEEIKTHNEKIYEETTKLLGEIEEKQGNKIAVKFISHEEFKGLTKETKAVIRTGEITPYANIILKSGVVF